MNYWTPFERLGLDPTYVILDWLVAWGVMELKKVGVILCWWVVVVILLSNNFSLCLLSFIAWTVPNIVGLCIPLPFIVGQSLVWRDSDFSLLFHKKQHNGRHNVLSIPPLDDTVRKIYSSIDLSSYPPISVSNWCEEILSYHTMLHEIHVHSYEIQSRDFLYIYIYTHTRSLYILSILQHA